MNTIEFEEIFIYYDEHEDTYVVFGRDGELVVPICSSDEIGELK